MLSLYAKGLTTGEISAHFAEIYGASVSRQTISRITDKVIEEMNDWSVRLLDSTYAAISVDAMVVKGPRRAGFSPHPVTKGVVRLFRWPRSAAHGGFGRSRQSGLLARPPPTTAVDAATKPASARPCNHRGSTAASARAASSAPIAITARVWRSRRTGKPRKTTDCAPVPRRRQKRVTATGLWYLLWGSPGRYPLTVSKPSQDVGGSATGASRRGGAGASGLWSMLRRPLFLFAVVGDGLGFVLQVVALSSGPVVVIQPLVVLMLPVSLAVSFAMTRRRPTTGDYLGVLGVLGGLSVFLVTIRAPAGAAFPGPVSTQLRSL